MFRHLLFILCLLIVSCDKDSNPHPPKNAIPVTTIKPRVADIPENIETLGILKPAIRLNIHSQHSGVLNKILAGEGENVYRNQPLFQIDNTAYLIQMEGLKAQILSDEAQLNATQKKIDRFYNLRKKDLISQTEWDELETLKEKAVAQLAMNKARLNEIQYGLDQCCVTAPISGRVGKLDISAGAIITPQTILTEISQIDPLLVEFYITQQEFQLFNDQLSAFEVQTLTKDSPKDASNWEKADLTFLDNQFDSQTGLLLVKGRLANSQNKWRAGQYVRVRIPFNIHFQALLIPLKAVRYNEKGPYVYVVNNEGKAEIRQLTLGRENQNDVIVKDGIISDDQVVLEGYLRLSPGSLAEIKS